ncbi:hypothetical protein AHF37_00211 [Paragonimus kellicotti]|nr:hypothetical protein AHF37_00211 [Paragonimus kellicotti]
MGSLKLSVLQEVSDVTGFSTVIVFNHLIHFPLLVPFSLVILTSFLHLRVTAVF